VPSKIAHDDLICAPSIPPDSFDALFYLRFTLSYRDVDGLVAEAGRLIRNAKIELSTLRHQTKSP
jgi:hypothetical protein